MFKTSYYTDQRLEIVILGPMRGEKNDSSIQIRNALKKILREKKSKELLEKHGVIDKNIAITFPEEWKGSSIERDVFSKLDTADLVVFNITPREGETNPSPNVFYELGLVHIRNDSERVREGLLEFVSVEGLVEQLTGMK